MTYLETLEGKDKLNLIETLREVTEGKVRFLFYFCFNGLNCIVSI